MAGRSARGGRRNSLYGVGESVGVIDGVAVGVGVTLEARDLGVGVGVAVGVGVGFGVENVSSSSDNNDSVSIARCDDAVDAPTDAPEDAAAVEDELELAAVVAVGVG